MNLSVKSTLKLHMVLIVILISLPLVALNFLNKSSSSSLKNNNEIYSDILLQLSRIDSELRNSRFHAYAGYMHYEKLSVSHYHAHPFDLHLNAVRDNIETADQSWISILDSIDKSSIYRRELLQLKAQYDAYMNAASLPVVRALETHNWDSIIRLITAAIPEYDKFSGSISALQVQIDTDAREGYETSQQQIIELSYSLYAFYAVAIILYVVFSIWLIRRIINPLNENIAIARKISAGDLTSNGVTVRQDEFGLFQVEMEKMRTQLSGMIGQIITESATVSDYSSSLKEASKHAEQSTATQMERLTNAASALEELLVSINDIARNTDDTSDKATQAQQTAVVNSDRISETESGIQNVSDNLVSTSLKVQELSEQVDEISSITGVIQDVASQTNLLALNAAIEAARAGEQGRGFAVVADEVRGLAETTTQSVGKISSMIACIQENAISTVNSMQSTCKKTDSVVETTKSTRASMADINRMTYVVQELIAEISRTLSEQKNASDELSGNVELVAGLARENSELIVSISTTADDLSESARQLDVSVSGFRLSPATGHNNGYQG